MNYPCNDMGESTCDNQYFSLCCIEICISYTFSDDAKPAGVAHPNPIAEARGRSWADFRYRIHHTTSTHSLPRHGEVNCSGFRLHGR